MIKSVVKKILEEVAAKKESRPALKCIHYENGNAVATDSHQLVRFNNINQNKDFTATIDASTLLPYNEDYPKIDRIIPSVDDSQVKLTLDSDNIKPLVDFLKCNIKNEVNFNINEKNKISVSNEFGGKFDVATKSAEYNIGQDFDSKPVILDANYLYEALRYLNKLGKELREINAKNNIEPNKYNNNVVVTFYGELRPFLVTYLNMQYIIAPRRKR